jgi:dsRNA-specific ribonuclease
MSLRKASVSAASVSAASVSAASVSAASVSAASVSAASDNESDCDSSDEPINDNKSLQQDGDVTKCGDKLIFNPFNTDNVEITLNDVQSILKKYGINAPVHNIEIYKRAFIHSSYIKRPAIENKANDVTIIKCPNGCMELKTKSNERLEFIGDGVLELITKYYLYRRFPKADEGFMTEKKIAVVKNEHIGKLAHDMQINKWLVISKFAEEKKIRTNLKKLGCLFEAFIGALFLDFNKIAVKDDEHWFQDVFVTGPGFQMAQIFVENVFETHIDWVKLINTDDNYKNILQVKVQKEFKTTPAYLEMSHQIEIGYEMGVYLCVGVQLYEVKIKEAKPFSEYGSFSNIQAELLKVGWVFVFLGSGTHKIKKKAEQIACERAIKQIHV